MGGKGEQKRERTKEKVRTREQKGNGKRRKQGERKKGKKGGRGKDRGKEREQTKRNTNAWCVQSTSICLKTKLDHKTKIAYLCIPVIFKTAEEKCRNPRKYDMITKCMKKKRQLQKYCTRFARFEQCMLIACIREKDKQQRKEENVGDVPCAEREVKEKSRS